MHQRHLSNNLCCRFGVKDTACADWLLDPLHHRMKDIGSKCAHLTLRENDTDLALFNRGTKFVLSFQIGMVLMKGVSMKPPLLVTLLAIGMLAGLGLIFSVL